MTPTAPSENRQNPKKAKITDLPPPIPSRLLFPAKAVKIIPFPFPAFDRTPAGGGFILALLFRHPPCGGPRFKGKGNRKTMLQLREVRKKLPTLKEFFTRRKTSLLALGGAFLLSASPLGEVRPFGLALLCACRSRRKEVLAGVLLASPFCGALFPLQLLLALVCYLSVTLWEAKGAVTPGEIRSFPFVKALLSGKMAKKEADVLFRVLTAGVCALLLAAVWLLRTGVAEGLIPASLCLAVPLFTFLFDQFFAGGKLYELSLLGWAFALTQCFRPIVLFGVPLSLAAGAFLTLVASRSRGFAFGCAAGVLCGLTAGGGAVGALGVTGITYGLLSSGSEGLALLLSYMISVSGLWYLSPPETVLPGASLLLTAVLIFLPLRARIPKKLPVRSLPVRTPEPKLARYAAAFSSLSGLFYTVSENASPQTVDDTVRNIKEVVSAYCKSCEGCDMEEGELCNCFTDQLRERGVVRQKDVPLHISRRCPSVGSMIRTLNSLPETRERECEKGIRRMAAEYAGMSSLLEQAAKTEEESHAKDKPAAARVREALKALKIDYQDVSVTGTRIRTVEVFGVRVSAVSASAKRIAATISAELDTDLTEPDFRLHGDYAVMRLTSVPLLRVEYAKCRASKTGEQVNGDTASFFETADGKFFCLLSDGMGSGRDAALTSRLAAIMLEKLLTMGADKAEALRMLNKALLEKEKEIFTTVDLLEIDLYTGQGVLIKAGAAPTLLFRHGSCRRFEAKTPPAGIMRDVIAEKRTFRLEKGDLLLMLSDGVLQVEDPPMRIPVPADRSAHAYASAVLSAARSRSAGKDDMSVCAVRLY